MKLEDQVCSLELSKQLKELGVKQESLFYWAMIYPSSSVLPGPSWNLYTAEELTKYKKEDYIAYSAFTVAELGEMLPKELDYKCSEIGYRPAWFKTGKIHGGDKGWWIMYADSNNNYVHASALGDTETDARAEMLIYLLTNKLITL